MKATKAEISKRVNEVLEIRISGAEFHDILQYSSEHGWNVGERQLWNYIHAADKLLVERLEKDRDRIFARHVAQRRALYARCLNVGDFSSAGRILRDEAELLGLYPAKKSEVTGKDGGPVVLNITEEIVGLIPPADLSNIVEEVVTHDTANGRITTTNGAPAPGAEGVP
jgi:hypothetical protein